MAFEGVITELEELRELLGRLRDHHHLCETQRTVLARVQRQLEHAERKKKGNCFSTQQRGPSVK